MKRVRRAILVALLVLLALPLIGVDHAVTSGTYTVHRGETLYGGLFISSPGVVTIEEGARVEGSIFMGSGVLNVNGAVDSGIFSLSGEVHMGPNAVVRGHVNVTSVPFETTPGARIENNLAADVSGWIGGPVGTALVLLAIAAAILWAETFRAPAAATGEAKRPGPSNAVLVGGLLLVTVGAMLLVRMFTTQIEPWVWALAMILPGLALLGIMLTRGRDAGPLAVPAVVLVGTGAVLAFLTLADYWTSWAYAWALILPASFGLGRAIEGWWGRNAQGERAGLRLAGVGVAVFALGLVFFEFVAGAVSGSGVLLAAVVLVAAGAYVLYASGIRPARRAPGA